MRGLSHFLLLFILCLFSPFVLWLGIAEFIDQPTYLALARSGLLMIGLATIVWAGLRDQPRMVRVGLALIGIGFLTFYYGESWTFPSFEWTEYSLYCKFGQRLEVPIPPMSRITYGHLLAGGVAVLNTALLLHDTDIRNLLVANLMFISVVVFACVI
ncbi:hypothetical protein [Bythopirellula polymerisocia]|uniref:Uncharacterized protein n=1 Tax=Bythopirellula polymerisocia TaxID=2528003 RepID=A0A5C6CES7_9BACT|nr:hypothetical protein [Bythopirellula polymerisocia]TWU21309.1 hypothetical protein Pla144_47190 [Bythopirellula polymerisocia]